MTTLAEAVEQVRRRQLASDKPLAIMVAGHNGSGKSTMWTQRLAPRLQMPLINADRMMMSILPEPKRRRLPGWARRLRDETPSWMQIAQRGVEAFVVQAMSHQVPFAMETVFSDWRPRGDGSFASKIDRIQELQGSGYFVLLLFVGLTDAQLSIGRVATRVSEGGHAVEVAKLEARFPRTQRAIREAIPIADAAILMDNSRDRDTAFTVCRVQIGGDEVFDLRSADLPPTPNEILAWLQVVSPRPGMGQAAPT
jgi:predicted ABC-type ATPase